MRTKPLHLGLLSALVALSISGCVATVSGPYVARPYDASQCYWTYVDDGYGGYEQLHCWSPPSATYVAVVQGGHYVRRYPAWYRGRRVVVVAPRVRVVRPRGRIVVRPMPRVAPRGRIHVRTR